MTTEFLALGNGEQLLTVPGEELHRQAHPTHLEQDEAVSFLVFRPGQHDDRQLSVRQGSRLSAEQAYYSHVDEGLVSLGTLTVTVGEVGRSGLRAVDDSEVEGVPEAHAFVDFRSTPPRDRGEMKSIAALLHRHARQRGWTYRP